MSIPANIFELLEDENDTEVKKPATSAPQTQKQKPASSGNQQQKKAAEPAKTGAAEKGKASPKSDKPPRDSSGATADAHHVPRNKPPRQQRESKEHFQKEDERETQERPGHRTYDRKSGTGRGKEIKRHGGGRANWGTQDDDKKAQEEPSETEVKEETQPAQTEAKPENAEAQPTEQKEEPKEEEDNTKTLEDYLNTIKKPAIQLPPPRQIETDDSKGYKKTKEDESQKKEKKEEKKDEKKEEPTKKVIPADQVLKFNDSPKPFGRGGRGGKRGDSPRGGRGKRGGQKGPAPNFKDESSFPSLATATKA